MTAVVLHMHGVHFYLTLNGGVALQGGEAGGHTSYSCL